MPRCPARVLPALCLALAAHSAEAGRIALLIGVGEYRDNADATLEGPPNDVGALARELTTRWGFERAAVRQLVNGEASRAAILSELAGLQARSAAGDSVFIYFSGHGTSRFDPGLAKLPLPYSSGAFVPSDFPMAPGTSAEAQLAGLVVGSRDVRPVLMQLEQGGRNVFFVADSCYSGQAVRGLFAPRRPSSGPVPRFLPLKSAGRDELERQPGLGDRPQAEPYPYTRVVFLSAASDSESAMDIPAIDLKTHPTIDGKPHGALTDALLKVMAGKLPADADRSGGIDYAELHRAVTDYLKDRGFGQTPNLLPGTAEDRQRLYARTLFAGAPAPPDALVPPVPVDEVLRVRLQGLGPAVLERLRTEPGIEITSGPADVTLVAAGLRVRLLGPAMDLVGVHDSVDGAVGHVRQLAWSRRLRRLGEQGRTGLLQLDTNPPGRGSTFIEAETMNFVATSPRDMVLLLIDVNPEGRVTVLYPHTPPELQRIAAGAPRFIPGTAARDLVRVTPPFGTDVVLAFGFDNAPPWLAKATAIVLADPGATSLRELEAALRASAGHFVFTSIDVRTIARDARR